MTEPGKGFLQRWSKRKAQAKVAAPPHRPLPAEPAGPDARPPAGKEAQRASVVASDDTAQVPGDAPAGAPPEGPRATPAAAAGEVAARPLPSLADVAALTRESDYAPFVAPGVDEGVKRAALKKLFSDPHFNVMDGLDTYIGDYNTPDPIPASMLRQMWQSKALGLFDDEQDEPQASPDGAPAAPVPQSTIAAAAEAPTPAVPPDEDTDLRLQPDDEPGRAGAGQGARSGEV